MVSSLKTVSITRKERTPIATIRIIRKELNAWKVRTKIVKILKTKQFYSVRLELRDLPGVGVNGKGISLSYALASAYSEFMERFLSSFLVKSSFFNKDRSVFLFTDETIIDYETFYRKWKMNIENTLFPDAKVIRQIKPHFMRVCEVESRNLRPTYDRLERTR